MESATGWDAIDGALRRLYGEATPYHLGTKQPWALGGPDPLDGISIFGRTDPIAHWHYVGYGMSELYEKESADPHTSGWGFEFTMRVVRSTAESQPPLWPAQLLQTLGRYVFQSENRFEPGHTMKAGGPLAGDRTDSAIRAMAFTVDPELGEIGTPHGSLRFLQVVGLTLDEYQAALGGNAPALLARLAADLPLYVTDADRPSLIERG
ncbi:Suppressor of fused protein (SUFU) [Nocardia otitidiscaviarum]|uniref:Suppressor of fused protein (SUFU) n=1 Tax=Nocardia otitidiscaviarum TaxID=1823 RepID=A0A379JI69_9NOCA|nr:suppressor of fused domain protein [Nocardia otitidiscaviarum]SUD48175.1 Suppressor of fused protein (SUFU) [Nocardia otitidiscaviarum]